MADLYTHNAANVILTLWDVIVTGIEDSEGAIEIGYRSDLVMDEVGYNGDVAQVISSDRRGDLKVKLLQGSRALTLLGAKPIGYRGPVTLTDLNSVAIASASACWLKKPGAMKRGKGQSTVELDFTIADLKYVMAGFR